MGCEAEPKCATAKAAVPVKAKLHTLVPEQFPVQPRNRWIPGSGRTRIERHWVRAEYELAIGGHEMPDGLLVTWPGPSMATVTVKSGLVSSVTTSGPLVRAVPVVKGLCETFVTLMVYRASVCDTRNTSGGRTVTNHRDWPLATSRRSTRKYPVAGSGSPAEIWASRNTVCGTSATEIVSDDGCGAFSISCTPSARAGAERNT